jgi:uncharacterized repeat protein (TIGR03806 family)
VKRIAAALGVWLAQVSAAPVQGVNRAAIETGLLPTKLSDFRFFLDAHAQQPNARVMPYKLNTPLFSDYAEKQRFVFVPEGANAAYHDDRVFDLPVGSALIKSFGYPVDFRVKNAPIKIIETRVLIHRPGGWVALPYVWNTDGSDAELKPTGVRIPVSFVDAHGQKRAVDYSVPNRNQCKGCHDIAGELTPIGPKARNLNDGRQLQALVAAKMLDRLPADAPRVPVWNDPKSGNLNDRARAYLDVNCGHCHNRAGPANTSGLWLDWHQPSGPNLGLGKRPTAAGRGSGNLEFAIAPGSPDKSIMLYRMKSLDPGVAMPELGRASIHEEGVALISAWIAGMPKDAR